MKSLSAEFRRTKIAVFTILAALDFEVFGIFDICKFGIFPKIKMVEMAICNPLKQPKLISRKNQSGSEN